jgi:bifunctional DNA-binding transcriptional regulator/antitoxin component of YhaV-PrlF toxin-antitoxin module
MRATTISRRGQIVIPRAVRHRWGTTSVAIEDLGNAILIRPVPPDPIGAAIGSLVGRGPDSGASRSIVRIEEAAISEQRNRRT